MESAAIDPVTTLLVAFMGLLGVTVAPIVLAILNRGGKAHVPPMPNLDLLSDMDSINERLIAENVRLTEENVRLRAERDSARGA